MTASEFAFLAMGLILGLAAGAALVEVLRARPPAAREVRVTMSTDAVPRRSSTLAEPTQAVSHAEPARGGPADRRDEASSIPLGEIERRTAVLSAPPVTAAPRPEPRPGRVVEPAFPLRDPDRPSGAARATGAGAIPVSGGIDPLMGAFRASAAAAATAAMRVPTTTALMEPQTAPRRADTVAAGVRLDAQASDTRPDSGSEASGDGQPADDRPCAEVRRVADERCELAMRSREQGLAAEASLRAAQRAYDDHESRADAAQAAIDPRAIRQAKDAAQERFRQGRSRAATNDEVEAAARTWLNDVNEINAAARTATAALARERAAAQELGASLEHRSMEADAARISAEAAEAACLEAREAVAACEEASSAARVSTVPPPAHAPGGPFQLDDDPGSERLVAAIAGGSGTPRIFRLVRGERQALQEVVAALATDDPEDRMRWQRSVAALVDAIVADAIDSAALDFPPDHAFWGPFTLAQDRDIVRALASLGYRFDGLGGWLDERMPSQRDLSLALGYAGLDPMRVRHWPTETEMTSLFSEVTVAADEHLAGAAGDLTLGELVSMLGRRADPLAELWNHWGRIRPLLLEDA